LAAWIIKTALSLGGGTGRHRRLKIFCLIRRAGSSPARGTIFIIGEKMNQSDRQLEEFITRLKRIEGEMQLLQEEKKDLFNEYKDSFEPKVLREAVRAVKARIKLGDSVVQLDDIINKLEEKMSIV
jgi:uncharacterized protein (UPF0335 family)